MKTNAYISGGLIAATLTLFSSGVFAFGLGFTSGSGTEEWEDKSTSSGNLYTNNGNREISNFGFVLDSAVAQDRTFNYRLSLMAEDNNAEGTGLNMSGGSMTHDFGFAIFRNRNIRLWMGPRLRFASYRGFEEERSSGYEVDDGESGVISFAVGPVIGFNVHLPRVVTFSITAAFLSGFYEGEYNLTSNGFLVSTEDVDVESTGMYINASLILRIRDNY